MKTPSELSRLYRNIDRKNLSPTAQETLKKIMKANGNWRKRDEKVQQVFLDFYEKLKEKKPVLIKTTPEYKAQLLEIKRANVRKAAETRAAKFQDSKEKEGAKGNQRDAARPAKRIGWRLKGKNNYKKPTIADIRAKRAYFENRVNRSDKKRKKFPMLEKGGYMARGGQVEFLYSDSNFDNKYYKRFNGAIGSFAWIYEKRYNEGILYPLDAFDLDYYSHLPLKENEVILRYQSDVMRNVGGGKHLIKFNVKKMLVYFMEDAYSDDDKNIKFSPKGLKLEYLTIEWQGLSSKQQMNIDLDKFDKGGNVDATYSVWVRKGASDDEEVVKSNLTKSQAKKLMDSLWDKDEYYEIGMSSSTYGDGGTLEDYDQLIGKTILIYSMGVKTPNSYKISGVKPPDPRFSIPTLMLEVGGGAEYIEGREKIANFLKGNQIEMNAGGEYYAIELVTDSKSKEHYAKGGQTPFEKLSNKVADNYEGKKVPNKYQKLYGKTYDRSEAKEVGDKVAAKVYRLQLKNKMAKGGEILFTDKHRND